MNKTVSITSDELRNVVWEMLYNVLGGFLEATVATDEVMALVELSPKWDLRIHFLEDAYETPDLVPADVAISSLGTGVTIRQMPDSDLWYSHRGWCISGRTADDVILGDGYLVAVQSING